MQTPASPSPTPAGPDSNDRLLAGVAHASSLLGLWLIGPLVIYCVQREKSRFVAHHAMRAMVLQFAFMVMGIISLLGVTVLQSVAFASRTTLLIGAALFGCAILMPSIYVLLTVLAMVRAFRGQIARRALFAPTTEAILRRDAAVPKA